MRGSSGSGTIGSPMIVPRKNDVMTTVRGGRGVKREKSSTDSGTGEPSKLGRAGTPDMSMISGHNIMANLLTNHTQEELEERFTRRAVHMNRFRAEGPTTRARSSTLYSTSTDLNEIIPKEQIKEEPVETEVDTAMEEPVKEEGDDGNCPRKVVEVEASTSNVPPMDGHGAGLAHSATVESEAEENNVGPDMRGIIMMRRIMERLDRIENGITELSREVLMRQGTKDNAEGKKRAGEE